MPLVEQNIEMEIKPVKPKRVMSEAQLANLARAREAKALKKQMSSQNPIDTPKEAAVEFLEKKQQKSQKLQKTIVSKPVKAPPRKTLSKAVKKSMDDQNRNIQIEEAKKLEFESKVRQQVSLELNKIRLEEARLKAAEIPPEPEQLFEKSLPGSPPPEPEQLFEKSLPKTGVKGGSPPPEPEPEQLFEKSLPKTGVKGGSPPPEPEPEPEQLFEKSLPKTGVKGGSPPPEPEPEQLFEKSPPKTGDKGGWTPPEPVHQPRRVSFSDTQRQGTLRKKPVIQSNPHVQKYSQIYQRSNPRRYDYGDNFLNRLLNQ